MQQWTANCAQEQMRWLEEKTKLWAVLTQREKTEMYLCLERKITLV